MSEKLNAREMFRTNVGIPTVAKLVAWAQMVHAVYPEADVLVGGSALKSKTWNDIDVYIALPDMDSYQRAFSGHRNTDVLGAAWDVISAAWSALAREVTGVNVEARLMARPSDWLDGTLSLLTSMSDSAAVPERELPLTKERTEFPDHERIVWEPVTKETP